jgi:hypothetical protein
MMHSVDFLVLSAMEHYAKLVVNDKKQMDELFKWARLPILQNILPSDVNQYIEDIKTMIKDREITHTLVYPETQDKNNIIFVYSSGRESKMYFDDYGNYQVTEENVGRTKEIKTHSVAYNEINSYTEVSRGATVKHPHCDSWFATVEDTVYYGDDSDKKYYTLILDRNAPVFGDAYYQSGYVVQCPSDIKTVKHNHSGDDVSVTIQLITTGSYIKHYLATQFYRFILKISRKLLNMNGFQVATASYGEIVSSGNVGNAMKFKTAFMLQGIAHDDWIYSESLSPNSIEIGLEVTQDNTEETTISLGEL